MNCTINSASHFSGLQAGMSPISLSSVGSISEEVYSQQALYSLLYFRSVQEEAFRRDGLL